MAGCIAARTGLPLRQRSHPAHIPQEVAGCPRLHPAIPARGRPKGPALARTSASWLVASRTNKNGSVRGPGARSLPGQAIQPVAPAVVGSTSVARIPLVFRSRGGRRPYATGSRACVMRSSRHVAVAASRAAASCSGGSSVSRASSAGRAAKAYEGGSCSWPSAKVSIVAACSRSPVSRRTAPTPLSASSSSEIAAEA